MSHYLDTAACEDAQRREDLARSDAALIASAFPLEAANKKPAMRAYLVQVKDGARVISEFGCMGPDSMTVAAQHECLAEEGQVVRVTAVRAESFPVAAVRQELECTELRDDAAAIEADLAYLRNQKQRDADRVRIAHQMDVDAVRRAGL